MSPLPSPDRLRELLDYDPKTGALTWKARDPAPFPSWNKRFAGKEAGFARPTGGIMVTIDGVVFLAHRLIWAMVHGTWPACIRHRNEDLWDNRLRNLRNVSRTVVQRERGLFSNNKSGTPGVYWANAKRKWTAQIKIAGSHIYLGSFSDKAEAIGARLAAEREHGFYV
jgi:hypothetical protein